MEVLRDPKYARKPRLQFDTEDNPETKKILDGVFHVEEKVKKLNAEILHKKAIDTCDKWIQVLSMVPMNHRFAGDAKKWERAVLILKQESIIAHKKRSDNSITLDELLLPFCELATHVTASSVGYGDILKSWVSQFQNIHDDAYIICLKVLYQFKDRIKFRESDGWVAKLFNTKDLEFQKRFGQFDIVSYYLEMLGRTVKWVPAASSRPIPSSLHFQPEPWQWKVIDAAEAGKSVLVCAPTSAGKTFIVIHLIHKILENINDDATLVFVCPTKALVMQVWVDIFFRFLKQYPRTSNRRMLGMFTGDDKFNVMNCQVLVTVPQCLEILLLSANSEWKSRLKYVIFDEIHSIGEDEGVVWEHLLALVPCPFIGLSATLSNKEHFLRWMRTFADVTAVFHDERVTDLAYFVYSTDKNTPLEEIHPCGILQHLPTDTREDAIERLPPLLPHQTVQLYRLMYAHVKKAARTAPNGQTKEELLVVYGLLKKSLDPRKYFNDNAAEITRQKVVQYDKALRRKLQIILQYPEVAKKILAECGSTFSAAYEKLNQIEHTNDDFLRKHFVKLVRHFAQVGNKLPAIAFCLRKNFCIVLLQQLVKKGIKLRDCLESEIHLPEGLVISPVLRDGLRSGIGVHHSGLSRGYRLEVERLFRARKLMLVIATGTLAMGIHMPCKTVIFAGDTVHLTTLQYLQMQGRAGRRGCDTMGNVVFLGLKKMRVVRLISSNLPAIDGHMPLTTTLVLRLLILLSESSNSRLQGKEQDTTAKNEATRVITKLLSSPFFCTGRQSQLDQVRHHLRFSIDFLIRQGLIDQRCIPIDFAGLVSHLYYTEPSNILFTHFLAKQMFDSIEEDEDAIVSVISHLFCPIILHPMVAKEKPHLALPPLPSEFGKEIKKYNARTMLNYSSYLRNYSQTHWPDIKPNAHKLPVSKISFLGDGSHHIWNREIHRKEDNFFKTIKNETVETYARSPFAALSCGGDLFSGPEEVERNVHAKMIIEPYAVPIATHDIDAKVNPFFLWFFQRDTSFMDLVAECHMFPEEAEQYLTQMWKVTRKIATSFEYVLPPATPLLRTLQRICAQLEEKTGRVTGRGIMDNISKTAPKKET
eukprot:Phypoly_transcript_01100.p1 GENE.Phypoly_transcript_01100~~Phypoly_transcript_01100.p1  ORF type:complete len:1219 (+),score=213.47 Phypoly_transcript_01100:368-3658(+)